MEKGTREMNANELADELEKRHLLGGYASEAATMLRQQQAEIEALKAAKIRAYNNGVEDGRKPDTNNKPVAYVDKIWIERPDLVMSQQLDIGRLFMRSGKEIKNYIPLYTHPVKELTDEEIANTWDDVRKDATLKSSMKDIQDFARAILRKAQEK